MPMQIRLTVLGPRGSRAERTAGGCDVLVTAPRGTALAAVAGALASAAASAGVAPAVGSGDAVPVFAGDRRLHARRQLLGVPPLVDGAVVSLYGPAPVRGHGFTAEGARARLHVVAGPDAGGVHLLRGGEIRVGRSAGADVPLDDPDVSRLHCAIAVADDGAVTVADLASTNGTAVDGTAVYDRPVPLPPGATLRLGESAVRVSARPGAPRAVPEVLPIEPDGAGRLRILPSGTTAAGTGTVPVPPAAPAARIPAQPRPGGPAPGGVPGSGRRGRGGISAWARRLAGGRSDGPHTGPADPVGRPGAAAAQGPAPQDERWPDLSEVLLAALGPGPLLWGRGPDHPDALTVRLGTVRGAGGAVTPVTADLREAGSLGLAGPRPRLLPLARSVVAQLAALHGPETLELVLIATEPPAASASSASPASSVSASTAPATGSGADAGGAGGAREGTARTADWSWLGWLPHLRPARGQDCRLLLAYDREQAAARIGELLRRPAGRPGAAAPRTVVVVDGDPGSAELREAVVRLAERGPAAGVHLLCLAEAPAATPLTPLATAAGAACAAQPALRSCGTVGLLSGAVATAVRIVRRGADPAGAPVAAVDGVSAAWAERFARALAPLRRADTASDADAPKAPPRTSRLLEELELARATPAALLARWEGGAGASPRAAAVIGAGPRGPVAVDLVSDRSHLLVSGAAGGGKTELLRSLAAALAAGERPDRLGLVIVDGGGDGLRVCGELPHASTYLPAGDPVRMREFAQALGGELERRARLLGVVREGADARSGERHATRGAPAAGTAGSRADTSPASPASLALRARGGPATAGEPFPLPRLVILVDDLDALIAPAPGDPGRPAAGSVVRVLEAVARDGLRLGVHLVAATGRPDRTARTLADRTAALRVSLGAGGAGGAGGDAGGPLPGRGVLHRPDGSETPFQAGRISGRIPRTSTLRPTVVPLDWARAGDPPARRIVRELGNGPTDLALLASAVQRAAREAGAEAVPPLL